MIAPSEMVQADGKQAPDRGKLPMSHNYALP
jgi:hypothetical protein